MDSEQDPTEKNDIDPSIDPKVLIEQESPNAGRIAAVERGDNGSIEGLPVIGAMAKEDKLNEFRDHPGASDQLKEQWADTAGTEAMATEVKSRAVELAKKQFPLASPELIDQFGQKAAEKFKAELESKSAEKKAKHDKGVQGLIDSLDSPNTPLSDLVPEVSEPGADTPEQESQAT